MEAGYPTHLLSWMTVLILSFFLTLSCHIVSEERFALRRAAVSGLCFALVAILDVLILSPDSPAKLLVITVGIVCIYRFVYGFRARRLLLKSLILLLTSFTSDVLIGSWFIYGFDSATVAAMRYMTDPITLVMQCAVGAGMMLMALLYRVAAAVLKRFHFSAPIGYLLRPLCLMGIVCFIFAKTLSRATLLDQHVRFTQMLPDFVVILMLTLIGVAYVLQDIRFFNHAKQNKQLLHQQSLQELLLKDTRVFRHNISNMLYGMQGTLLSGDVEAIRSYYHSMVEACQLINNENVVALKRLPSQAVSSLLINKIHQANAANIPFFVTVAEGIEWHGLREEDMTRILGILVDNAIEAAAESAAPYVSVEAQNVGGALEITVRNTCRNGEPAMIAEGAASTKPGHEGLGLASIRDMLKKKPNVLFNIYPRGRYMEASLICY